MTSDLPQKDSLFEAMDACQHRFRKCAVVGEFLFKHLQNSDGTLGEFMSVCFAVGEALAV
jgi:hypothetical protein